MFDSPQDNANRAWERLGKKMGFDHMTVAPIPGKGPRFFTAVPAETPEMRDIRLHNEDEAKRLLEVERLKKTIADAQVRLDELTEGGKRP